MPGGKVFELSREDRVWMRNAGETKVPIPVGYVRINNQGIGYLQSSSLCKPQFAVEAAFERQFVCFCVSPPGSGTMV